MLIATWNVNSLKARMPRVEEWLETVQPDVLCLQETKLSDAQFPAMAFAGLGYETAHHGYGQWNGVAMERIEAPRVVQAKVSRVVAVQTRPGPYEGHMFHDEISLASERQMVTLSVGDWWVSLDQDNARYAVETLEPGAHDSFFRWGFFNSILEKKEHFSDYVFEDMAVQLLADEPALAAKFADWKEANPQLLSDQTAVLSFIFENCARFAEPQWRRYPVLSVLAD